MAYEQRDMSGTLFANRKKDSDRAPNAKGEALIDGVAYWVSAWTRRDKNGNPWQSLAFTRKDERPAEDPAQQSAESDGWNDEVPF